MDLLGTDRGDDLTVEDDTHPGPVGPWVAQPTQGRGQVRGSVRGGVVEGTLRTGEGHRNRALVCQRGEESRLLHAVGAVGHHHPVGLAGGHADRPGQREDVADRSRGAHDSMDLVGFDPDTPPTSERASGVQQFLGPHLHLQPVWTESGGDGASGAQQDQFSHVTSR